MNVRRASSHVGLSWWAVTWKVSVSRIWAAHGLGPHVARDAPCEYRRGLSCDPGKFPVPGLPFLTRIEHVQQVRTWTRHRLTRDCAKVRDRKRLLRRRTEEQIADRNMYCPGECLHLLEGWLDLTDLPQTQFREFRLKVLQAKTRSFTRPPQQFGIDGHTSHAMPPARQLPAWSCSNHPWRFLVIRSRLTGDRSAPLPLESKWSLPYRRPDGTGGTLLAVHRRTGRPTATGPPYGRWRVPGRVMALVPAAGRFPAVRGQRNLLLHIFRIQAKVARKRAACPPFKPGRANGGPRA